MSTHTQLHTSQRIHCNNTRCFNSIGQVYKAVVRATGQVVALKVQRPEAQASAAIDMFILRRFAAWFKQWKKLRTDMVGVADEFGSQLFQELDYIAEGQNAVRFKELYGSIPGIYVPSINFDLTSRYYGYYYSISTAYALASACMLYTHCSVLRTRRVVDWRQYNSISKAYVTASACMLHLYCSAVYLTC
jgi:ABC1 atypical kinase-like domain